MICLWLSGAAFALPSPTAAQFQVPVRPAVGENYNVEIMGGLWKPAIDLVISSSSLGIEGTDVDLEADLGVEKARFREYRAVLRPGRKHKFRIQYLPIRYTAEAVLKRDVIFNGTRLPISLPIESKFEWHAWRFGYEYDFVYRSRGFVGFIAEVKYTDVKVTLESPLAVEFARAQVPIPALGGIARGYVTENTAITFEITGFKIPERLDLATEGRYVDWDVYGTANFSNNFGLQVGYRSIDVTYLIESDAGDLKLKGLYFAAVTRF